MLRVFDINSDEIIPVCVVATMSSGKSTFLNAILSEEILPEKNEACTARALAVINIPGNLNTKAYIKKNDGNKYAVDIINADTVSNINADEDVTDVLIVKNITTLINTDKSIVLVDTPGVNNSGDVRHGERTKEVLEQLNIGVIVYILNATQLATNDDEVLLQMVVDYVKKKENIKIIFVLNKIDMLDEEKESISGTIKNAIAYIKEQGIDDFEIFPVSALSAKTFRLKLNSKSMTKTQERHINQNYHEYKDNGKSILKYMNSYNQTGKQYYIGNECITEYQLRRAIENTGIVEIEKAIEKITVSFEQQELKNIKKLDTYTHLEGIYSPKRRTHNRANYSGKAYWNCKKCGQVNGDNKECLYCKEPNVKWVRAFD